MNDNSLGPISVEWLLNNQQVIKQAEAIESTMQGLEGTVQRSAKQISEDFRKAFPKLDFGNSKKEVEDYLASLQSGKGRVASNGLDELIRQWNEDLAKGKITAQEFKEEIDRLNAVKNAPAGGANNQGLTDQEKILRADTARSIFS